MPRSGSLIPNTLNNAYNITMQWYGAIDLLLRSEENLLTSALLVKLIVLRTLLARILLGTTQNEPDIAPHFILPLNDTVFGKMKEILTFSNTVGNDLCAIMLNNAYNSTMQWYGAIDLSRKSRETTSTSAWTVRLFALLKNEPDTAPHFIFPLNDSVFGKMKVILRCLETVGNDLCAITLSNAYKSTVQWYEAIYLSQRSGENTLTSASPVKCSLKWRFAR